MLRRKRKRSYKLRNSTKNKTRVFYDNLLLDAIHKVIEHRLTPPDSKSEDFLDGFLESAQFYQEQCGRVRSHIEDKNKKMFERVIYDKIIADIEKLIKKSRKELSNPELRNAY